jgi:hypothetical protein
VNAPDCNREVALQLASAGLHVFPCDPSTEKPRSKRPLVENWPNRATNVENGVRHYWGTRPGAIVGLPLGKAGLVVVDLDVGHGDGLNGVAEYDAILDHYGGSLDSVPVVRTWSGGYHCYYRQPMGRDPLGNREGMLAGCGINVRGAFGYTIAPGSVMATGEFYECVADWPDLCEAFVAGTIPEMPGWLVELIEWRPSESERAPSTTAPVFNDADADRLRKWALGALRNKARALAMVRAGNRNNALNSAVFALAGIAWCGLTEDEVYQLMHWACMANRLIADDGIDAFNATFCSGWDSGILKPLSGPKERYPDSDIVIDLKSKMGRAA